MRTGIGMTSVSLKPCNELPITCLFNTNCHIKFLSALDKAVAEERSTTTAALSSMAAVSWQ